MIPQMYDVEAQLSPNDIESFERRYSVKMPDEYRAWLLQYNGGQPVPGTFAVRGGEPTEGVAWFFAIYDGEYNNMDLEYRFWKITTGRVPGSLVPIACDGSGNLICLSFGGPDQGKVYFWDHEAETEPPSLANCHLVADTFDEFIQMLGEPRS